MYFPIINRLAIWGYMTRCNIAKSNLDAARGYRIMNWNNRFSCFPNPLLLSVLVSTKNSLIFDKLWRRLKRIKTARDAAKIVAKHLTINSAEYRLGTFTGKVFKGIVRMWLRQGWHGIIRLLYIKGYYCAIAIIKQSLDKKVLITKTILSNSKLLLFQIIFKSK